MTEDTWILIVWAVLIIPTAVVFKTWITPEVETGAIVAGATIWPFLLLLGIFGVAVFIVLVLPTMGLTRLVDLISKKLGGKS